MRDATRTGIREVLLGALLLAGAPLALWALSSHAQVIDTSGCERACYQQNEACVDACSGEGNPIECEARCDDALEDCLEQCR